MLRKSLFTILLVLFLLPLAPARAASTVQISVFEREDCAHCQDLKVFLSEYARGNSDVLVRYIDIYTQEGLDLYDKFTSTFKLSRVTPIILVGDTILIGFGSDDTTGQRIQELVSSKKGQHNYTVEEYVQNAVNPKIDTNGDNVCDEGGVVCSKKPTIDVEDTVHLPFFGALNIKKYSLLAMAVILGFIDGFNPCAMWVLVMFLTILLKVGSRKRMFQLAGLFILAESIMYYFIMGAWITAWDFIGLDKIITPIVGMVAVGAGIFFLYEYRRYRGACKVISFGKKQKLEDRIKKIVSSPLTIVGILGILGIAFSVNIIEFACSIGIPQAFTKVLDINGLSWITRQFYIFIYVIFYMVDDFIVFGIAMYTFGKLGFTTKYSQLSNLLGGILMLLLGLMLLFAPNLLMF